MKNTLLKKTFFFPKFKLLNSGCGLSAGVNGICRSRHRRALQTFAFPLLFDGKMIGLRGLSTLPGKFVMCQSSDEWNKFRRVPLSSFTVCTVYSVSISVG